VKIGSRHANKRGSISVGARLTVQMLFTSLVCVNYESHMGPAFTLLRRFLTTQIKNLPYLRTVYSERDQLRAERDQYRTLWPPGHYYSSIPSIEEIKRREEIIFSRKLFPLPAVNLYEEEQLALLDKFKEYYKEQPFSDHKQNNLRYFFSNPMYSYADAIFLYCMIRHMRPRRIIEVGSGYSSAVIMDTNEIFFQNKILCTFIDPFQSLLSLMKEGDEKRNEIIKKKLQDVDVDVFSKLSARDILFIDSTHVSKIDSDVNLIFFCILPRLKRDVYVHFHDVFYPFEYPKEWVYEGRAWNEAYLLRAFLQYNDAYKIVLFNDFLAHFHEDKLSELPLCMKNTGGSIWIKRIR